jgi:hypothetical protein
MVKTKNDEDGGIRMTIQQSRINSMSKLAHIPKGKNIVIGINNVQRFPNECVKLGFIANCTSGTKILPSVINPSTRRNAEIRYLPDKSKPKETVTRPHMWTREEWAGRGETRTVTGIVWIPYQRYPRIEIVPYGVELTYLTEANSAKLFTNPILNSENNQALIKNTINIFLTIFGECEVLDENHKGWKTTEFMRLNWEILPPGVQDWDEIEHIIEKIAERQTKTNQVVWRDNSKYINSYEPNLHAIGRSGFHGYIVYGFEDANCYILESMYSNNATYVLGSNWKTLSQLTKSEILSGQFHKARLFHDANWQSRVGKIIEEAKVNKDGR